MVNHITLRLLDEKYAEAVCGEILEMHPKLPQKKYGFHDWKLNVNCQKCLREAFEMMERSKGKTLR